MGWYDDVRDTTLKNLGLSNGVDAVNTVTKAAKDLINPPGNPTPNQPTTPQPNVWQVAGKAGGDLAAASVSLGGIEVPIIAIGALAALYFLMKRR